MATVQTIPVTVTAEAAARIAFLGIQPAIDQMLDYARQHFPELDRIEIQLYDRYELGDEPGLAIQAYSRHPFDPADRTDQEMGHWIVRQFPPEVLEHVILCYLPGAADAR
jgi:hypothetical protein